MCFHATVKETDALAEKMKKTGGKMRFWKKVTATRRSLVGYPIAHYKKGSVVVADRKRKRITRTCEMTSGIYIYIYSNHQDAPDFIWEWSEKSVRVEAHIRDLIGSNGTAACFRKVKVVS